MARRKRPTIKEACKRKAQTAEGISSGPVIKEDSCRMPHTIQSLSPNRLKSPELNLSHKNKSLHNLKFFASYKCHALCPGRSPDQTFMYRAGPATTKMASPQVVRLTELMKRNEVISASDRGTRLALPTAKS